MLPNPPAGNGNPVPPAMHARPLGAARPARAQLRVENGGLYEHAAPTPEQYLERAIQEIAASAKRDTNSKAYAGRSIADVAQGACHTLARRIAKLITENLRGGGPIEFGERMGHALITFNAQKARQLGRVTKQLLTSGDHRGAA